MKRLFQLSAFVIFVLCGCGPEKPKPNIEQWKSEIVQVEKDFNAMAQSEGLANAFHHYAASDGVIRRKNKVVQGKSAIKDWYLQDMRPNETLQWTPTFVEVSNSGDLAYTYGDYIFKSVDSTGVIKENTGIFHTVWKRQTNGEWKFVWD